MSPASTVGGPVRWPTMEEQERYEAWVGRYLKAWNSNAPEDIAELFTDDARYFTEPYAAPWSGREEIVERWLENKDEPGDTTFDFEILVATPELGIVKGRTTYKSTGTVYANIWELRLDDSDRSREFVEWWMEHKPKR